MLILAGEMTMSAAGIDALRTIYQSHKRETEREDGCILFSLGLPCTEDGPVTVLEMWRDEEAILQHNREPHTARFIESVGPGIEGMNLHIYESSGPRPLPDLSTLDEIQK